MWRFILSIFLAIVISVAVPTTSIAGTPELFKDGYKWALVYEKLEVKKTCFYDTKTHRIRCSNGVRRVPLGDTCFDYYLVKHGDTFDIVDDLGNILQTGHCLVQRYEYDDGTPTSYHLLYYEVFLFFTEDWHYLGYLNEIGWGRTVDGVDIHLMPFYKCHK